MRTIFVIAVAALSFSSITMHAQSWQMPADAERCPSKWGADDQLGSGNLMKPEMALRAAKLIHTGEVFSLGFELSADLPLLGTRRFDLHMKRGSQTKPGTRGENEEIVITELGQVGTQLDGLAHQMYGGEYYNCVKDEDMNASGTELAAAARGGFPKLGVEHVPAMVTRAVLIDVAALKNVAVLPESYAITAEDLQQALAKEKVSLQPGDAVLVNTGWGTFYTVKDKARYVRNSPGLGISAGEWLVKQNPMMVGADNCCVEVRPYPGQNVMLPLHAMFIIVNGIHIVENLKLDQLAAAHAYETAFIMEPLKIKGGTGSTVAPIAIR